MPTHSPKTLAPVVPQQTAMVSPLAEGIALGNQAVQASMPVLTDGLSSMLEWLGSDNRPTATRSNDHTVLTPRDPNQPKDSVGIPGGKLGPKGVSVQHTDAQDQGYRTLKDTAGVSVGPKGVDAKAQRVERNADGSSGTTAVKAGSNGVALSSQQKAADGKSGSTHSAKVGDGRLEVVKGGAWKAENGLEAKCLVSWDTEGRIGFDVGIGKGTGADRYGVGAAASVDLDDGLQVEGIGGAANLNLGRVGADLGGSARESTRRTENEDGSITVSWVEQTGLRQGADVSEPTGAFSFANSLNRSSTHSGSRTFPKGHEAEAEAYQDAIQAGESRGNPTAIEALQLPEGASAEFSISQGDGAAVEGNLVGSGGSVEGESRSKTKWTVQKGANGTVTVRQEGGVAGKAAAEIEAAHVIGVGGFGELAWERGQDVEFDLHTEAGQAAYEEFTTTGRVPDEAPGVRLGDGFSGPSYDLGPTGKLGAWEWTESGGKSHEPFVENGRRGDRVVGREGSSWARSLWGFFGAEGEETNTVRLEDFEDGERRIQTQQVFQMGSRRANEAALRDADDPWVDRQNTNLDAPDTQTDDRWTVTRILPADAHEQMSKKMAAGEFKLQELGNAKRADLVRRAIKAHDMGDFAAENEAWADFVVAAGEDGVEALAAHLEGVETHLEKDGSKVWISTERKDEIMEDISFLERNPNAADIEWLLTKERQRLQGMGFGNEEEVPHDFAEAEADRVRENIARLEALQ